MNPPRATSRPFDFERGGAVSVLAALGLLAALAPRGLLGELAAQLVADARSLGASRAGRELQVRNYYDALVAPESGEQSGLAFRLAQRWTGRAAAMRRFEPWPRCKIVRNDDPFLPTVMIPDSEAMHAGALIRSNHWGMRDVCEREKPAGCKRIALLGSSVDMGWGVPHEATYEVAAEEALNASLTGRHYEILNFSNPGYSIIESIYQAENQTLDFSPDLILVSVNPDSYESLILDCVLGRVAAGRDAHYEFVSRILDRAGVGRGEKSADARRKLRPFRPALFHAACKYLAAWSAQSGVPVRLIVVQLDIGVRPETMLTDIAESAEDAGVRVIPLFGVLKGLSPSEAFVNAGIDEHPSALAHQRIAAALLVALRNDADAARLLELAPGQE
ncbi:MAG: hypothetical protein U1D55_08050 [Phycisphaerae bacterium]